MRIIIIFGGTFNPPHKGHLEIINYFNNINYDINIQSIEIIPSLSWQKSNILNFNQRFEMVKLFFNNINNKIPINVSDYELNFNQNSYSINTLKYYRNLYPDYIIYFVIGSDQLANLHTWYKYESLFHYAHLYVIKRDFFNFNNLNSKVLSLLHNYQASFTGSKSKLNGNIIVDNWQPTNVSSSLIRQLIKENNLIKVKQYLSENVIEYIIKHKLYV